MASQREYVSQQAVIALISPRASAWREVGLKMPDPRELKVGDRVRFVALPEEWATPGATVPPESRAFMKAMLKRRTPSVVFEIDEYGIPWIRARIAHAGRYQQHTWAISEHTGWRRIEPRLGV